MLKSLKNKFLYFSLIFIISAVSFFIAYNWKEMGNYEKLAVPGSLVILGSAGWFFLKKEIYKNLSLFFTSFMVGSLFAVFGQVYQTGADTYSLFLNWGLFTFIFAAAGCFYPIWILNISIFTTSIVLFSKLYCSMAVSFFIGALFLFLTIFIYLAVVKKLKLQIDKLFFYTISTGFIALITLSAVFPFSFSDFTEKERIITALYFILLGIFTYVSEKKIYKQGVLPLAVVSLSCFVWSEITNFFLKFYSYYTFTSILYYYIIVSLCCLDIFILSKISNNRAGETFKKIIKIIISVIKLMLLLELILSFVSMLYLIGMRETSVLIGAMILFILSAVLPKWLKFKEDKTEIVSFATGIILLALYIELKNWMDIIPLFIFLTIIFNLFFWKRHSKGFDYLIIPVHWVTVMVILSDYFSLEDIYKNTFAGLLALLGILTILQSKGKLKGIKLKRIIRGLEIIILAGSIISNFDKWLTLPAYSTAIAVLVSAAILFINFTHKESKENSSYLSFTVTVITILGAGYFCLNLPNIIVMMMLIILYIHRKEKYYEGLTSVFLVLEIYQYYYLTHITLLEKSFSMFKAGALLFIAYLLLEFFSKKGELIHHEK